MKYIEAGSTVNIQGLNIIFNRDITEETVVKRITSLVEMLFKIVATDSKSKFIDKYLNELHELGVVKMTMEEGLSTGETFEPIGFYNLSTKIETTEGYKLAVVRFAVKEVTDADKLKPILDKIATIITENLSTNLIKPMLESINFTYFDLQNELLIGEDNVIINPYEEYTLNIYGSDFAKIPFNMKFTKRLNGKELNHILTQLDSYINKEISVFELKYDLITNYKCVLLNDIIIPSELEN